MCSNCKSNKRSNQKKHSRRSNRSRTKKSTRRARRTMPRHSGCGCNRCQPRRNYGCAFGGCGNPFTYLNSGNCNNNIPSELGGW